MNVDLPSIVNSHFHVTCSRSVTVLLLYSSAVAAVLRRTVTFVSQHLEFIIEPRARTVPNRDPDPGSGALLFTENEVSVQRRTSL
uniref:Uncharacterized protein n=1 Tax=Anguilla anguilla TaxID=7936 RepID=A0A0E9XKA6_ANGAN